VRIRINVTETVEYSMVVDVPDDWQSDYTEAEELDAEYDNRAEEIWCEQGDSIRDFDSVTERDVVWHEVTT